MNERNRPGQGTAGEPSVQEALARAATHGRRAASEALLAARALLDALSITLHGALPEERRFLRLAARGLDDLADALAGGPARPGVLSAIADALDTEIARWEARARNDTDARAVLRAYLGLREILWEFGVRANPPERPQTAADPVPEAARPTPPTTRGRKGRRGGGGRRMKRVPVEG